MRQLSFLAAVLLVAVVLAGCGPSFEAAGREGPSPQGVSAAKDTGDEEVDGAVGASNSFLAAVARDLLGNDAPLVVMAKPGMCPGHFDIRPSQVRQAAACRVVLRFDFQKSLDARFQSTAARQPRVVEVDVAGGLCEPKSYVAACRQVAEVFVAEGLLSRETADPRLADVTARMDELDRWAREQIQKAGLADAPVLASRHQAAFCCGLGLKVAAEFPSADTAGMSEIDQSVKQGREAGVRLIVANLPEGRQAADALAERFQAKVVVFGNFPMANDPQAFEQLVRDNVMALVQTAGQP